MLYSVVPILYIVTYYTEELARLSWTPKIIYFMFSSYLYSDASVYVYVYRCLMMVRGIFLCCYTLLDSSQNAIPLAQRFGGGLLLSIPSHTYVRTAL